MWLPYICLGIGIAIGLNKLPEKFLKVIDALIYLVLIVLMLTIGMNLGVNESVVSNLSSIGFNCLIISLCAIACSVICVIAVEKTLLPLDELSEKIFLRNINADREIEIPIENRSISPLIWIMLFKPTHNACKLMVLPVLR